MSNTVKYNKSSNSEKIAQGVVEYILVFIIATFAMYMFATKFDFKKLRGFAVYGIFNNSNNTVVIPPMTE